jgi:hypothetical protein
MGNREWLEKKSAFFRESRVPSPESLVPSPQSPLSETTCSSAS